MNLAPFVGSLALLVFAAGLIGVTYISGDPEGPIFERGKRTELLIQLAACGVAFIAGCQL